MIYYHLTVRQWMKNGNSSRIYESIKQEDSQSIYIILQYMAHANRTFYVYIIYTAFNY